ncbi:MAG: thioesterase [Chloroflexi bacterium]|nr:MAG: thioesterase [Chloroflexota bacterium]
MTEVNIPPRKHHFPDFTTVQTLPCFHRECIPESYLDLMGHMNIRYYIALFDAAAWKLFARFGMDMDYYRSQKGGAFALEQHVRYLAEVHAGETVAVHTRLLGRTTKRIHFIHFMLNETTEKLAATLEVIGSHADIVQRRTSPFPPAIAARIDEMLVQHQSLGWEAPVCGVMRP